MEKNLTKIILILLVLTPMVLQPLMAQEKPGCEPKSCGPDNTKVAEAKAVTDLRTDLQKVIEKMAASSQVTFDSEITSLKLEKGDSDDASVLIIAHASSVVLTELKAKLPDGKILPELKSYRAAPALSKQKLMVNLKREVSLLSQQMSRL